MSAIVLRTSVPGPRSAALLARKQVVIADPLSICLPVVVASGQGVTVTDLDGNHFLDFTGGIGALAVGHAHPRVTAAICAQAGRFLHTDFTMLPYENYVTYAERLLRYAPFSGPGKAAFFNSGAEAVENAVKIAKLARGRPAVIAFEGAFHGRTLMALSLTSKTHPYKAGMGPFAPEVYRAPFPNPYRGISTGDALAGLDRLFATGVAAESVAAIIVEPVQGEGGFLPAPPEFLAGLRERCDRYGIVLVADEVQTGFGRTGSMFAISQSGVEPDLVCVAKSIAAGLPLSGVLGRAALMDAPHDSAIGGTYVGNPVCLAAAHAVLDVIEQGRLVERARTIGSFLYVTMRRWQARWPQIGEVRGLGAMLAIELVSDPAAKTPAPELAAAVAHAAAARGLLLLTAGVYGNCIRVLCPLVITDAELVEAAAAWEGALAEVLGGDPQSTRS